MPGAVTLTRPEAIDVLVALDDGADHAVATLVFGLGILLEDAVAIMSRRMFPDLPEEDL